MPTPLPIRAGFRVKLASHARSHERSKTAQEGAPLSNQNGYYTRTAKEARCQAWQQLQTCVREALEREQLAKEAAKLGRRQ
jgi:hypothetical protein